METIFVSLIAIVMVVLSTIFMVTTSMNSAEKISDSLKNLDTQSTSIQLTAIDANFIGVQEQLIQISVANIGQRDMTDLTQWDVMLQRQDGGITRLSLSPAPDPGANQWAIEHIYIPNGTLEIFDPGILNPDEYMIILINAGMAPGNGEVFKITVATSNGITSQCLAIG
ncbi:hypothetical protein DGWBC_1612 [Dehalogenimonas sp. WBC-2]|nr:hypothetical protein DGWBC_1612 [Dehalogenimonas sp. WBC-2]